VPSRPVIPCTINRVLLSTKTDISLSYPTISAALSDALQRCFPLQCFVAEKL